MKYFEAPNQIARGDDINPLDSIFLAGSISGAWNWQYELAYKLRNKFHIFNPRRENFDANNPLVELQQISWEYQYLQHCYNIFFYFSHETLAPITLFEYGCYLAEAEALKKKLFVVVHPEYKRRNDILIQTGLRTTNYTNSVKVPIIISDLTDEKNVDDVTKKIMDLL